MTLGEQSAQGLGKLLWLPKLNQPAIDPVLNPVANSSSSIRQDRQPVRHGFSGGHRVTLITRGGEIQIALGQQIKERLLWHAAVEHDTVLQARALYECANLLGVTGVRFIVPDYMQAKMRH